ncbi:hypothetical protein HMPREF0185_02037 [Brevundimonas diminuta 470-4]|nr:hypothetical protein HMPREF0185_02037 [Brevundimonas diminuta 470-4]
MPFPVYIVSAGISSNLQRRKAASAAFRAFGFLGALNIAVPFSPLARR